METILNLIWFGITLATIWFWRFHWANSRRSRKNGAGFEIVAMVCGLALLFPVISLTDDLHPEIMVVESGSGKRNHSLLNASAGRSKGFHAAPKSHALATLLPRIFSRPELISAEMAAPSPSVCPANSSISYPGRSPPYFL